MIISMILYFTIPINVKGSEGLTEIGPDFFPTLIILSIGILSLVLFIRSFYQNKNDDVEEDEVNEETNDPLAKGNKGVLNSVYVFLILVLYVFILLRFLNFTISTVISMFIVMWILSVRKWYYYAGFLAFVLMVDYVFRNLLNVQLP